MNRVWPLLVLALAYGGCAPVPPASLPATGAPAGGLTRHVVVFKYKEGTSSEQIREVTQAFSALRHQIPGIVAFEHGVNNSPEGLNMGFDHVYLLTFTSPEARDAYLPHPAHAAFGALLRRLDILEGAFVVDYSPQE